MKCPHCGKEIPRKNGDARDLDSGALVEKFALNDGSEFEVHEAIVAELERLYPAVDAKQTLREIRGWCIANSGLRKTRRGAMRFLFGWFEREQNKPMRRF